MQKTQFEQILEQLASDSKTSSAEVRERLRIAMADALESQNPTVQAMWHSVPKKGKLPTLEEFMDYLIERKMLQP